MVYILRDVRYTHHYRLCMYIHKGFGMKKATLALLTAISMLLTGCGYFALPVFSAAPGGEPQNTPQLMGSHTVAAEEYLSLREEPDTSAKVLRKLARGTIVTVKDYTGRFALVEVRDSGETGYVLASYLLAGVQEDLQGGGEQPGPTNPAQSRPPPIQQPAGGYRVRCEESLTLRAAPSPSAKAVGRISNGTAVQVSGFEGPFARVKAGKQEGYVLSGYLVPVKQDQYLAGLEVVEPAEEYSYDRMAKDLKELARRYPKQLKLESAGKSAGGRDIPVAVLGDPKSGRHVLVQAAIHGREHMTALLVMAQLEYCLKEGGAAFGGGTVEQWLEVVCLHILPMANPDGVAISQHARMTDGLQGIYQKDKDRNLTDLTAAEYLAQWKANGTGVDINRNFPTGWQALETPDGPSATRYKGAKPADQPETKALMEYTKRFAFDATVSYHATGSCVYWQYGEKEQVNKQSRSLAQAVEAVTGYPLEGSDGLDAGGYKDWAMDDRGIPSVTIEIGSRPCPLPIDEFATVWVRNRNVLAAVARWAKAG